MIAIIVVCDECSAEGIPGAGRAEMQRDHGWSMRGRLDLCSECETEAGRP